MHRLLLATIAFIAASTLAHGQERLEWKFKEGDRFQIESEAWVKQRMHVVTQQGPQKGEHDFEHVTLSSFTVKKVDKEGNVELEQRLDKVKATNRQGTGSPAGSSLVRELEDCVFTITLDAKRKVTKLDGYDDMIKRVSKDDANAAKAIRELVRPETLRQAAEEAFAFLPDKPLAKGDTWERKVEASMGPLGTIQAGHTYTYEGKEMKAERMLHKISVASTLSYTPPKEETPGFAFKISKGTLKAEKATGTLWFDAEAGRLAFSEANSKLGGTITAASQNQPPHEITIDQEQTVRMSVSWR